MKRIDIYTDGSCIVDKGYGPGISNVYLIVALMMKMVPRLLNLLLHH